MVDFAGKIENTAMVFHVDCIFVVRNSHVEFLVTSVSNMNTACWKKSIGYVDKVESDLVEDLGRMKSGGHSGLDWNPGQAFRFQPKI